MLKKLFLALVVFSVVLLSSVNNVFATDLSAQNSTKTLTGIVSAISGSQIFFRAGSAALYAAEIGSANLVRKYGAPMKMEEVLVGDKVEVKGLVWSDNSISVTYLRDLSLYAHNSTFTGKVIGINPTTLSFAMQSKEFGVQNIIANPLTAFKKNGQASSFLQVELGMSETVKATWERSYSDVLASSVAGVVRLISIEITGTLTDINGKSLTITADNVIYGADVTDAKIQNKGSKITNISNYNIGDTIKVVGKHISEGVFIKASVVKNLSSSK